jgi:PAS domain S-box-containing protein
LSDQTWIHLAWRRRWVLLAAIAPLALGLLLLAAWSLRDWRQRALTLERENAGLQLAQVAHELTAQWDQLGDQARDLAQSESTARLLQDNAVAPADRLDIADMPRNGADALLILSASHTVRFSLVIAGGQLIEESPDPDMMRFVDSGANASQPTASTNDRWFIAQPVLAHAAPAPILGWVVVSRRFSSSKLAQLANSAGATLTEQPVREFDPASLGSAQPFGVTTHLSDNGSSGYVALRNAAGQPVRVFRLTRNAPISEAGSRTGGEHRSGDIAAVLVVGLIVLAIIGALIFALKRYFRQQRSVDARYKALIDQANDGIVIVDAETHQVLYTNPAFLGRLGYSNEEAQSLTLTDIFADGSTTPESVLARLVDADSQMALNLQQRRKNGALFDTEVRCNALDVDGRDVLAFVTHDVSLRRKAEQQLIENQQRLDKMAHHDQLTGLPNRHYLTAFLPQAIEEAKAANSMLGVVFLDLDRFKHINDTRGHETGDKLLQEVAAR